MRLKRITWRFTLGDGGDDAAALVPGWLFTTALPAPATSLVAPSSCDLSESPLAAVGLGRGGDIVGADPSPAAVAGRMIGRAPDCVLTFFLLRTIPLLAAGPI